MRRAQIGVIGQEDRDGALYLHATRIPHLARYVTVGDVVPATFSLIAFGIYSETGVTSWCSKLGVADTPPPSLAQCVSLMEQREQTGKTAYGHRRRGDEGLRAAVDQEGLCANAPGVRNGLRVVIND